MNFIQLSTCLWVPQFIDSNCLKINYYSIRCFLYNKMLFCNFKHPKCWVDSPNKRKICRREEIKMILWTRGFNKKSKREENNKNLTFWT